MSRRYRETMSMPEYLKPPRNNQLEAQAQTNNLLSDVLGELSQIKANLQALVETQKELLQHARAAAPGQPERPR